VKEEKNTSASFMRICVASTSAGPDQGHIQRCSVSMSHEELPSASMEGFDLDVNEYDGKHQRLHGVYAVYVPAALFAWNLDQTPIVTAR